MDQGVIRALKAKYRSGIVKFYITYIEAKGGVPRIRVLDAMKFLVQALDRVKTRRPFTPVSGVKKVP